MYGLRSLWRRFSGCQHCFASSQSIPFNKLVLTDWLHFLHMISLSFFFLTLLLALTETTNKSRSTAYSISLGLGLMFFLFGDGADLIKVARENFAVGNIFGGFTELQENNAGTDDEEAKNNRGNLNGRALEALKEDGGCYYGRGGEKDVVRRRNESGIEYV